MFSKKAAKRLTAFLDARATDSAPASARYAPDHEDAGWQVRDRATGRMLTDRELMAIPLPELLSARLPAA